MTQNEIATLTLIRELNNNHDQYSPATLVAESESDRFMLSHLTGVSRSNVADTKKMRENLHLSAKMHHITVNILE